MIQGWVTQIVVSSHAGSFGLTCPGLPPNTVEVNGIEVRGISSC